MAQIRKCSKCEREIWGGVSEKCPVCFPKKEKIWMIVDIDEREFDRKMPSWLGNYEHTVYYDKWKILFNVPKKDLKKFKQYFKNKKLKIKKW